jgi:hypothetical protein
MNVNDAFIFVKLIKNKIKINKKRMSNKNIQFRRGTKTEYDTLVTSSSGVDNHDIYIIGGTTVNDTANPLRMYVGNEPVQSVLSSDIPVTVNLGAGITQNTTLEAGTPIETVLRTFLCQEKNPKAASKPTLTVAAGTLPDGLAFVGDTVTIDKFTMSEANGTFNSNGWTSPAQPNPIYDGTLTYSMSSTGFSGYVTTSDASGTTYSMTSSSKTFTKEIPAQSGIVVSSGPNSVTLTGTFNYNAPENYPKTNLNNVCTSTGSWTAGTASGTTSVSVIGVRPAYTNGTELTSETQYGKDTFTHGSTTSTLGIINTYTKNKENIISIGFGEILEARAEYGVYVELPSNITQVVAKTYKDDEKAHLNVVTLVSSTGRTENDIQYTRWTYASKRGAGTIQFFTKNTTTGA